MEYFLKTRPVGAELSHGRIDIQIRGSYLSLFAILRTHLKRGTIIFMCAANKTLQSHVKTNNLTPGFRSKVSD